MVMLRKEAVNRYLLGKSHLLPETQLDSVGAVLRDLVALDANNLEDAYFSLSLRVKRFDVVAFEKGLYKGTAMARVKGLKNYMQIVPQEYLPAVYALSKNDREMAAKNLLGTWGIPEDEYRKVGSKIVEALGGREKTLVQLKRDLAPVSRDIVRKRKEKALNVSIIAQGMQDRWLLLRGGIGRHPGESPGRFSLLKDRFRMKLDMDRNEALQSLTKRYVREYGPVSAGDLAWWLGATPGEAAKALNGLDTVRAVEIEGVPGDFFIDEREERPIQETPPGESIIFLPQDDPYAKAYHNRSRFMPAGLPLITKFGASARVVLIDGAVRGTWDLKKDHLVDVCRVTMYEGYPEIGGLKGALERAAEAAGKFYAGGQVEVQTNL